MARRYRRARSWAVCLNRTPTSSSKAVVRFSTGTSRPRRISGLRSRWSSHRGVYTRSKPVDCLVRPTIRGGNDGVGLFTIWRRVGGATEQGYHPNLELALNPECVHWAYAHLDVPYLG